MVYSVIVIGAKGFLGHHFYSFFRSNSIKSIGTYHRPAKELLLCDLAHPKIDWPAEGYAYALFAGGMANPHICEKDPKRSYLTNVEGTIKLAKQLLEQGVVPVFFSSDYVFDGSQESYDESAITTPVNQYGRQKAELEKLAMDLPNALVIRLSKVYGIEKGDKTLFDEMASHLIRGEMISAATDQFFAPICISDLVKGVNSLLKEGKRGVVNAAGSLGGSRFEMACEVAKNLGCPSSFVRSISIDQLDLVKRPKRVFLKSDFPSISWKEGCRSVCENYC